MHGILSFMHACIHACLYVCRHANMYVCIYVCMHVYMYGILSFMHACLYVCRHAIMYVCMHVWSIVLCGRRCRCLCWQPQSTPEQGPRGLRCCMYVSIYKQIRKYHSILYIAVDIYTHTHSLCWQPQSTPEQGLRGLLCCMYVSV